MPKVKTFGGRRIIVEEIETPTGVPFEFTGDATIPGDLTVSGSETVATSEAILVDQRIVGDLLIDPNGVANAWNSALATAFIDSATGDTTLKGSLTIGSDDALARTANLYADVTIGSATNPRPLHVTGKITADGEIDPTNIKMKGGLYVDPLGVFGAGTQVISSARNIANVGSITASGLISGGSLSDGVLTISGGSLTSVVNVTASGTIQGATLTDGVASLSGGTITDGTLSINAGAISGATTISASGLVTCVGLDAGSGLIQTTGNATIGGNLNVDAGLFQVDATNNRFGFGVASPVYKFHWLLEGSDQFYVSLSAPTTDRPFLFAAPTVPDSVYFKYLAAYVDASRTVSGFEQVAVYGQATLTAGLDLGKGIYGHAVASGGGGTAVGIESLVELSGTYTGLGAGFRSAVKNDISSAALGICIGVNSLGAYRAQAAITIIGMVTGVGEPDYERGIDFGTIGTLAGAPPEFVTGIDFTGATITGNAIEMAGFGINATNWSITGAGAITAVSYGGIAEANLLDKSAAETISGNWTHNGLTTFVGSVSFNSNTFLNMGTGDLTTLEFDAIQTVDALVWSLDDTSKSIILTNLANRNKDFGHAAQTNPTLFIHSATDPATLNTEWISLTHDATDGIIQTGKGSLQLAPVANFGVQVNTTGTRPAASATYQGQLWLERGGAGVADVLSMCMKSATDTYSWVTIATG